jgi:hypothetical protein
MLRREMTAGESGKNASRLARFSCSPAETQQRIEHMPNTCPVLAPGSDGFTGRFFQAVCPIIKCDVLQALAAIWSMDTHSLYLLNQAYMFLLRKKKDTEEIKDFRPISLIHSFSKLFTKLLSAIMALFMHRLVLPNQSAFICGRAIHDNFHDVQSSAKLLHA